MNSKRFKALAIAVLGVFLLGAAFAGMASAQAQASAKARTKQQQQKKTVYPVKITIKIKPAVLPPDSMWQGIEGASDLPVIVVYGRVTSPKPACKRKREIIEVIQPDWAPGPEEKKHTGVFSDGTGYWEGEPIPDFGLTESIRSGKERIWAKVDRKSLGKKRFCAAAKSARLKA